MSGVRAVTPDMPYKLDMFSTPAQIGAPTLWGQVGGQANAGAGVKVAVIDSGIFVRYDADGNYTGNPCFDDAGYTAPKGYPKGDKKFTNNKVIVARAYFRPGDRRSTGENTPIQGTNEASPHGTHTAGHRRLQRGHAGRLPGRARHDQRDRAARVPHELPRLLPEQEHRRTSRTATPTSSSSSRRSTTPSRTAPT